MYDRVLRPEWIDFALEQSIRAKDQQELTATLRRYLGAEITTETSLRKTVSQLQHAVGFLSPIKRELLVAAYDEMCELAPDQRNRIRLEVLVQSTPFVADVLEAIRKLNLLGVHGVQVQQLYERLVAKYGDRGTIPRRVRYVLQTLLHLGIVENKVHKWFLTGGDA